MLTLHGTEWSPTILLIFMLGLYEWMSHLYKGSDTTWRFSYKEIDQEKSIELDRGPFFIIGFSCIRLHFASFI